MSTIRQTLYNQYLKAVSSLLSGVQVTLVKIDGTEITLIVNKIVVSNALLYSSAIPYDPDRVIPPEEALAELSPTNQTITSTGKYRVDYIIVPTSEGEIRTMLVKALINDQHQILFAHVDFPQPVVLSPDMTTVFRFAHTFIPFDVRPPFTKASYEVLVSAVCTPLIERKATSLNEATPSVEYRVYLK